jgi:hypothetical protein
MFTIRECLVAYLESKDWHQIPSRSEKYLVYAGRHATHNIHYYIGKSGGLRHGANHADSFSVPDTRKNLWINEGRKILEGKP